MVQAVGAISIPPCRLARDPTRKHAHVVMATNFDKTKPLAGMPPAHVLKPGAYVKQIKDPLSQEEALLMVKETFLRELQKNVNLVRVSNPLFLSKTSGFQDNLNGVERPVTFAPRDFPGVKLEVPFSLAKWKRWALHYYGVPAGKGLVTSFHGLRSDDDVDFTHSLYVDQFDWEKVIRPEDRNMDYLQTTVRQIYKAVYDTEQAVSKAYGIKPILPPEVVFVSSDELLAKYPDATPKERENIVCKQHGAVFLMGIGGFKADGTTLRHDGRAPDYDDWITPRPDGGHGINGDLLVWNPLLDMSFELSSMGIRVNPETMLGQLEIMGCSERLNNEWHKMLMDGTLPQTIGGGVGQSRLCQFMLRCAHIGEVQHGWYDPQEVEALRKHGITLLGLGTTDRNPMT